VPLTALALAVGAAVLHAVWNLSLAGARDPEVAGALALAVAVLVFAPVAALGGEVRSEALPYVAGSSALELAYFALLAAAYRRAELSVVYPVSRGLAPVLVLAAGFLLLGTGVSALQLAGVVLVGAGVALVRELRRGGDTRDIGFSVAIAVCIAGYTLVDKEGLRFADPVPYLWLVLAAPAALYLAAIGRLKRGTKLRAALDWRSPAVAIGMFGAYALTLAALDLAPAANVAAIRESSVVIATALAAVWLHEAVGVRRLAGAAVVAAGIGALALA
jgi:drug/metabolite transporter (DMT)-like permease